MKSFISTFTITMLILFFSLKIFVPATVLGSFYIPPKLGLVISVLVLTSVLNLSIKINYVISMAVLMCAGFFVAFGLHKVANDFAVIFYILLGATIIYDIAQIFAKQFSKSNH